MDYFSIDLTFWFFFFFFSGGDSDNHLYHLPAVSLHAVLALSGSADVQKAQNLSGASK